ncbi:MAG TPA: YraN family protein [Frankiaceae bacterium]|nr:YraN family protein [Frankiaceae bacterium]
MSRVSAAVGRFGEQRAAAYLSGLGYEILDRNWRVSGAGGDRPAAGELDLVVRDGRVVVFVEVKTRSGAGFGTPAEAVTADKVARIRRLAARWLEAHPEHTPAPVRFDVVSVLRGRAGVQVEHLRKAF